MDEIFVLIQKGIQCPFFVRPERAPQAPPWLPAGRQVGGGLHKWMNGFHRYR